MCVCVCVGKASITNLGGIMDRLAVCSLKSVRIMKSTFVELKTITEAYK